MYSLHNMIGSCWEKHNCRFKSSECSDRRLKLILNFKTFFSKLGFWVYGRFGTNNKHRKKTIRSKPIRFLQSAMYNYIYIYHTFLSFFLRCQDQSNFHSKLVLEYTYYLLFYVKLFLRGNRNWKLYLESKK